MDTAPVKNLAVTSLVLVSAACSGLANADEYVKTYSVGNHADVRIHADESSVRVITDEASNKVEFRVRTEGTRVALQIGGQVQVDSHQSGDEVELSVKVAHSFTVGFNDRSIKTEVHMPQNADLLIDTHDGAVEVSAVNGHVSIHTKDGSIKAGQLSGQIELMSDDGGITADALMGDTKIHTSDGSIGVRGVDGKLDAFSKDGAIRADGRFDSLTIKSGDGTVTAHADRGSKMQSAWNVHTGDGSVHLSLPSDLQANLDINANDGHINVDLPVTVQGYHSKSQLRGTLNGGGPLLTVRSGDGSIRIDSI